MKCLLAAGLTVCFQFAFAQSSVNRTDAILEEFEAQIYRRIGQHWHAGEFVECLSLYRILHGMHPDDAEISSMVVRMLGNLKRYQEELVEAISFRRAHPNDPVAATTEALLYSVQRLYERIPPLLEPIIDKSQTLDNFVMLARAYEKLGLFAESLRIWETRLRKFPDDLTAVAKIEYLKKLLFGK